MKIALLLALLMAACVGPADPDVGMTADDLTVCWYDCPICYPSCGGCTRVCASCPEIPTPPPPDNGFLPDGEWFGTWTCQRGCTQPVPGLTAAASVIIVTTGNDEAVWRTSAPSTLMKAPITRDGDCWRMDEFAAWPPAPGELGCRSSIEICGTTCDSLSPPGDCVIAKATWTNLMSGVRQTWMFTGTR